ncbi:MAG TPA: hypothetical protein VK364_02965 [Hymenobacter sp.]|nr:hypothetical protein [Hymenobacter sp.]
MAVFARIRETLARHGLRATSIRRQVLLSKSYTLSGNEFEQVLGAAKAPT